LFINAQTLQSNVVAVDHIHFYYDYEYGYD